MITVARVNVTIFKVVIKLNKDQIANAGKESVLFPKLNIGIKRSVKKLLTM